MKTSQDETEDAMLSQQDAPSLPFTREFMLNRAAQRDSSFDGRFITGVLSTGIYCLPSCSARNPKPENIRFFADEDGARRHGLRPCLRCKPDDYYRNYDADAALVEALILRLRQKPCAVTDVAAMAQMAGVGITKLNDLFRDYYHTTPALYLQRIRIETATRAFLEAEADVLQTALSLGYENPSTFYRHFSQNTGLAPGRYREMLAAGSYQLVLPCDYRYAETMGYLLRDPHALDIQAVHRDRWQKSFDLGKVRGRVVVSHQSGTLHVFHQADEGTLGRGDHRTLHAILWRLLGLQSDPKPFERHLAHIPELSGLIAGSAGLRIPQTASPWEGLVWTIIGQQIHLNFAYQLRNSLIDLCGNPVGEGLKAHPSPAQVAQLEYHQLTEKRFSRRKAEYLIDIAAKWHKDIAPQEWQHLSAPTLIHNWTALRGVGTWTANYLLMRSYGFADAVPLGDAGLVNGLRAYFQMPQRPDRDQVEQAMAPFRPYRSWATFHLWRHAAN